MSEIVQLFKDRGQGHVFTFFDDNKLVILLHGFHKKTQKIPRKEIERAKKLRRDYYVGKESENNK